MRDESMKRIGIAHSQCEVIGGAEIAIVDMCNSLSKNFKFIMYLPGYGRLNEFYREKGFSVVSLPISHKRRMWPGLHFVTSLFCLKKIRRYNLDLLLGNTLPAALRFRLVGRMSKLKVGAYLRDHCSANKKNGDLINQLDFVIAVSNSVRKLAEKISKFEDVPVAYDCIDNKLIESQSRFAQVLRGGVGIVGRIQSVKQQDLFIKSAAIVLRERPKTKFYIIGDAGNNDQAGLEYKRKLLSLVASLKIGDNLKFLGFKKNSIQYIRDLDVVCVPSKNEAFPRVILESNLLQTPVIAGNVGGCSELIEHGKTGFLFDSLSESAHVELAKQIIGVLSDEQKCHNLAKNARQWTLVNICSQKPVQFFQDLLLKKC
jgi:glycosyltransferase involved in cell wall biosynthesis